MIKAIETHYNGYRFRSRLEARWAVFFDALGVKYQYELEGFDLGELGYYLPDFYLPSLETWLEIKPIIPTSEEIAKILKVGLDTNSCSFVLFGDPGLPIVKVQEFKQWSLQRGAAAFGRGKVVNWPAGMPKDTWVDTALQIWRIRSCLEFWPVYVGTMSVPPFQEISTLGNEKTLSVDSFPDGNWYVCPTYDGGFMTRYYNDTIDNVGYDHPDLIAAYNTARQARFEHGESPDLPRL